MQAQVIALLLALLIGASLGALGSGGSIVTLPILVYVAGVDPKQAIGISMAVVGATSALGCVIHWRRGNFAVRPWLLFSVTGMPGAFVGSMATHLVSGSVLLLLFAALMVAVGVRMIGQRAIDEQGDGVCSIARCVPAGFLVGVVTGFLGVGGGFLIVPALIWFAALDAKRAMGTSLGIIALNSAAGLAGQLRYAQWDWGLTAKFLVFALAGMGLGIAVAERTPDRTLRRSFGMLVLWVAAAIAWQVARHA